LGLDEHHFSPGVIQMIAEAAGTLHSDAQAAFALRLAKIQISISQVQRIARQIGGELIQQRDRKVVQRRQRCLPVRVATPPQVVAVEVDGGRLRTRASGQGRGVHEPKGKEDKVACLVTLQSECSEQDPQPEPPEVFRQPRRVRRLVTQMKGMAADCEDRQEDPVESEPVESEPRPQPRQPGRSKDYAGQPRRRIRTCVATMAASDRFGPMVAAEAQERGFYQAPRKAFVSDGAKYNWSIHRGYFAEFEPITDFLHVLCYLYSAAMGIGECEGVGWSLYEKWLRACWQGRVGEVIGELEEARERVGVVPEGVELDKKDPRRLLSEAWSYLSNNRSRMDYPRYRRAGLPVVSSLVESLVGEFNARVKDRRKFWNRPDGVEAILQLRAAVLSEDGRLDRFFAERPGNPYRGRKAA
jgi:hypothetical protein